MISSLRPMFVHSHQSALHFQFSPAYFDRYCMQPRASKIPSTTLENFSNRKPRISPKWPYISDSDSDSRLFRGDKLVLYEMIEPEGILPGFVFGLLPGWWLDKFVFSGFLIDSANIFFCFQPTLKTAT